MSAYGHSDGRLAARERDDDDGFEMPKPGKARVFGVVIGPLDLPNRPPAGPSRAELEDRSLVDAALAIRDPWVDDEQPPLYASRARD